MIPILYTETETEFTSNGLGRLVDIISATVSEERNGIFECEFQYPITGEHYADIQEGRIISCTHDDNHDQQPFIIYRRSAPIDGIVTFNAHHISYELNNAIVAPFSAGSCAEAFFGLATNGITENRFSFITDKTTIAPFNLKHPASVRETLAGKSGSILDTYGNGEYKFDKFTVYFYQNRGSDNGVTIRYGKNLVNITQEVDISDTFNAIVPYWIDPETEEAVYGSIIKAGTPIVTDVPWTTQNGAVITDNLGNDIEFLMRSYKCVAMDMSDRFEEKPSVADLEATAQAYLTNNQPWKPKENLKVDFVALWQTEEYAAFETLQHVNLCDKVSVYYPQLGVNAVSTKVIKTIYNVLLERYDEIELGDARSSFADTIMASTDAEITRMKETVPTNAYMQAAIDNATKLLTGQKGGHIVFKYNSAGEPEEMFIMDTADVETARNVWRYNGAGWGHSSNGINGSYTLAATQDGSIVANMITTGILNGSLIRAGVIQGMTGNNWWDLENGKINISEGYIGNFTIYSGYLGWTNRIVSGVQSKDSLYINVDGFTRKSYAQYADDLHGYQSNLADDKLSFGTFNVSPDVTKYLTLGIEYSDPLDPYSTVYSYILCNGDFVLYYPDNATWLDSYCNLRVNGNFKVTGTKNREVKTEHYANRSLYSYETASPMFGDVGEGRTDESGVCYVWLDPVFAETIDTDGYQVFLQSYGNGRVYVAERHPAYFVVMGDEDLSFGWELKAKQKGYEQQRLDNDDFTMRIRPFDYGKNASEYINALRQERELNV